MRDGPCGGSGGEHLWRKGAGDGQAMGRPGQARAGHGQAMGRPRGQARGQASTVPSLAITVPGPRAGPCDCATLLRVYGPPPMFFRGEQQSFPFKQVILDLPKVILDLPKVIFDKLTICYLRNNLA